MKTQGERDIAEKQYSFIASAGTPRAIVQRLHAEIVKDVELPDMAKRFATLGPDSMPLPRRNSAAS